MKCEFCDNKLCQGNGKMIVDVRHHGQQRKSIWICNPCFDGWYTAASKMEAQRDEERERVDSLAESIKEALQLGGYRWSDWGKRAEAIEETLLNALNQLGSPCIACGEPKLEEMYEKCKECNAYDAGER